MYWVRGPLPLVAETLLPRGQRPEILHSLGMGEEDRSNGTFPQITCNRFHKIEIRELNILIHNQEWSPLDTHE